MIAPATTDGWCRPRHQGSLNFTDPDGMNAELWWIREPGLTAILGPVPVEDLAV